MLASAGDAVLVLRDRPRLLLIKCPCGCGDQLPINIDNKAQRAWRFYRRSGRITIFPSVWRDTGCESHFVLWNDKIHLFGDFEEESSADSQWPEQSVVSVDVVLKALSTIAFEAFADIAERVDALPWDVLWTCRRLVRQGQAIEGVGKQQGYFRKRQ